MPPLNYMAPYYGVASAPMVYDLNNTTSRTRGSNPIQTSLVQNGEFHTFQWNTGATATTGAQHYKITNPLVWPSSPTDGTLFQSKMSSLVSDGGSIMLVLAGNNSNSSVVTYVSSNGGVNWSNRNNGNIQWFNQAFGNGIFVGVGRNITTTTMYHTYTTSDAVTWKVTTMPAGTNLIRVAFANGLFYAITSALALYSSPDGVTWTRLTGASLPYGGNLNALYTCNNRLYLCTLSSGTYYLATSTDGINWQGCSGISFPTSAVMTSMTHVPNVGYFLASVGAYLATSTDGVSWEMKSVNVIGTQSIQFVTYLNGYLMMGPSDSTTYYTVPM